MMITGSKPALRLTVLLILGFVISSFAEGIQLGTNGTVVFASIETGREILTQRDDFIAALTPLDRRARMRTQPDVSEKDFLAFAGRNAQPWRAEETNRITAVFLSFQENLARWPLRFPRTILLIKTSGEEEFNNAYTRQNAIILPAGEAGSGPSALRYLLLHELFHVLSRHDPELRKAAYGVIGFRPINEIVLPGELLERKITNPDGVQNGWMITLTNRNETVQAVPILLATGSTFNPNERGANPYDYFRLLVVRRATAGWLPQLVAGSPRLLRPSETTGWLEQIGRNTRYTIHPDEILADNFVKLINGETNVSTPRIIADMANAFKPPSPKK